MADHTPYQRKIIDRYYKNLDAIKYQRLSELATDLYLAEGKKLDRLWIQVESSLRKVEFPEPRIAITRSDGLIRRRISSNGANSFISGCIIASGNTAGKRSSRGIGRCGTNLTFPIGTERRKSTTGCMT